MVLLVLVALLSVSLVGCVDPQIDLFHFLHLLLAKCKQDSVCTGEGFNSVGTESHRTSWAAPPLYPGLYGSRMVVLLGPGSGATVGTGGPQDKPIHWTTLRMTPNRNLAVGVAIRLR